MQKNLIIFSAFFLLISSPLFARLFYMKDGKRFSAQIISQNATTMTVIKKGRKIVLSKSDIDKIDYQHREKKQPRKNNSNPINKPSTFANENETVSPWEAGVKSAILPGWGQWDNQQKKSGLFFSASIITTLLLRHNSKKRALAIKSNYFTNISGLVLFSHSYQAETAPEPTGPILLLSSIKSQPGVELLSKLGYLYHANENGRYSKANLETKRLTSLAGIAYLFQIAHAVLFQKGETINNQAELNRNIIRISPFLSSSEDNAELFSGMSLSAQF